MEKPSFDLMGFGYLPITDKLDYLAHNMDKLLTNSWHSFLPGAYTMGL